jgi:pimeloyl-ACP methyl ester carboxylesterase
VAFIICISGIGTTGEEMFLTQTRLIAEVDGATEDEVEDRVQSMKHIVNLVRDGAGRADLEPEILRMVQEQESPGPEVEERTWSARNLDMAGDADDDPAAEVNCQLTLFSSLWFRSFLDHDARPILKSVKCPVLLIFGGLDRQVSAEMNREAMVDALERGDNSDYSVRTFPAANHLFQSAFLELMSGWILER